MTDFNAAFTGMYRTLQRLERHHGTPPVLGSPEWAALPEGHPSRIAAIYRAALCWVFEHDEDDQAARMKSAALDVAQGTDWAAAAQRIRDRADANSSGAYIGRKAAS